MFRALRLFFRDFNSLPRFYPISKWFMRIAVFVYVLIIFGRRIVDFSITSEYSLLAVVYIFFSFILFIAGFRRRSTLTRVAALILAATTVVYLITSVLLSKAYNELFATNLILLSILIYFCTSSKRFDFYKKYSGRDMKTIDEELETKPPLSLIE